MRNVLIFDFDGTLVDTITDVGLCFNQALQEHGLPQHPLSMFSQFVGGNLETVVSRMLPPGQCTTENITKVKNTYRRLYQEDPKPHTRPYPGMDPLLRELKEDGFYLAINSNKGQALLDKLTAELFPKDLFDAVVGYDETRPSKPSPYGVDLICKQCGCLRADAVYIGDGKSDIDTAANAGIPCIFAEWGQGTEADRNDERVHARANDCGQLKEAIYNQKKSREGLKSEQCD